MDILLRPFEKMRKEKEEKEIKKEREEGKKKKETRSDPKFSSRKTVFPSFLWLLTQKIWKSKIAAWVEPKGRGTYRFQTSQGFN